MSTARFDAPDTQTLPEPVEAPSGLPQFVPRLTDVLDWADLPVLKEPADWVALGHSGAADDSGAVAVASGIDSASVSPVGLSTDAAVSADAAPSHDFAQSEPLALDAVPDLSDPPQASDLVVDQPAQLAEPSWDVTESGESIGETAPRMEFSSAAHGLAAVLASSYEPQPIDEEAMTQRVLAGVQRQVDSMLEFRLREAMAPHLAEVTETLVQALRQELAATLQDVVMRAVAQEVSRTRPR
jgi:hypothetical protein